MLKGPLFSHPLPSLKWFESVLRSLFLEEPGRFMNLETRTRSLLLGRGCWSPVSAPKASPAPRSHLTNSRPAGKQAIGSLQTLPLDSKNVLWLQQGQAWDTGPAPGPATPPSLPVSSVSHHSPVSFIFPSCAMRGLKYISHFHIFVLQQNAFILNKAYTVPWCLKQINDALVKVGRGLLLTPPR